MVCIHKYLLLEVNLDLLIFPVKRFFYHLYIYLISLFNVLVFCILILFIYYKLSLD